MQSDTVKYFMWGFQAHYQSYLQDYAEELFGKISKELKPKIFLLGILRDVTDPQTNYPICLQPDECGISPESFKSIDTSAKKIYDTDPRKDIRHTMPHVHENYHEDLKIECQCKAIQERLDAHFSQFGLVSFISEPVRVNKYDIFVILQFNNDDYEKFQLLKRTEFKIHDYRKSRVYRSFADATVQVFLYAAIQSLFKPNQNRRLYEIDTRQDEILRISGERFSNTIVQAATASRGGYYFYGTCNYLAAEKYESKSSSGKLVIAPIGHPNIDLVIKLEHIVILKPQRMIRKLLEIASEDLFLYSDGDKILGFARMKGIYDPSCENLFEVEFYGYRKWRLKHSGATLMLVEHSNPSLPELGLDKSKFASTFKRIFCGITDEDIEAHWNAINSIIKQRHGALIVISKDAKEETKRLGKQATAISPIKLDNGAIKLVISIDGAVLLDTQAICHAIGVILDGPASPHGTPARGSRYNSAIRYVDANKDKAVAIIISEDGSIDLYPDLMPQIHRSEITSRMELLRLEANKSQTDYNAYWPILYWFDDHRFYLKEAICSELNALKTELDKKNIMEVGYVYVICPDFKPNPEMDDSYFLT